MKKKADLTSLVATKGNALPAVGMPTRTMQSDDVNSIPLNFRVSAEFRRRFRLFAAHHDLKLNELLRLAFDEYESRNSKG